MPDAVPDAVADAVPDMAPDLAPDRPWERIPPDLADLIRPYMGAAVEEMVLEIRRRIPAYAVSPDSSAATQTRRNVELTVRQFVELIGGRQASVDPMVATYAKIGAHEARHGRSLEQLQRAITVTGQIAARRFGKDARRLNLPPATFHLITESLLVFQEIIAKAAAQGYTDALAALAGGPEPIRARLRDALVAPYPGGGLTAAELARMVRWEMPATLTVVALAEPVDPSVLAPQILHDLDREDPFLVVPDLTSPAAAGFTALTAALHGVPAAAGPPVPPEQGAISVRWARRTLQLATSGEITAPSPVWCLDHLAALVVEQSRDLLEAAAQVRVAPLANLRDGRRVPLVETMIAFLQHADSATHTASDLRVHPQTVRYRVQQFKRLARRLRDAPASRLDLHLMLAAALPPVERNPGEPDRFS